MLQDTQLSKQQVSGKITPWPYLCAYLIPIPTYIGYAFGGIWHWYTPFCVFMFFPILELLAGTDNYNPTEEEERILDKDVRFRAITMGWSIVGLFMVLWGCYVSQYTELSTFEYIGFVISVAISSGGIGITIAHELIHKDSKIEQFLGKFNLLLSCYMHFYIEHLWGHHKRVATPEDPATARLGESFYQFWPRTVLGGFKSAWHIEISRLERKNYAQWGWHNQMLWFIALPLIFAVSMYYLFGIHATIFFFLQAFVSFSFLEIVNYLEHYGLERKLINESTLQYERVTQIHSWSASHKYTNYFLFKLQRHSDHHTWPARRYQILRQFECSPQLPTGYTGMIMLALVPPLWRRVMDPRVEKLYKMMDSERCKEEDIHSQGKSSPDLELLPKEKTKAD